MMETHAMHKTPTLGDLFDQADAPSASPPTEDVFLFAGNRQESVPRALFFDRRLTPIERNAWQIIKMLMESGGKASLPTYERLRPFLAATPCAAKASFETVAKTITLLRLTRWMTLVRRRRLPNGQIQSNIYVLHDEPLSPHETMQLDRDYFSLVSKAMDHSNKAIQHIGELCFSEISNDPTLGKKTLPTRLSVLTGRIATIMEAETQKPKLSTAAYRSKSEAGKIDSLRIHYGLTSESESGLKPAKNQPFLNPKSVRSSSNLYKKTTTLSEQLPIQLPERFRCLSKKQQNLALSALQHLEGPVQQQILSEWDQRCGSLTIRKPPAYLMGIIQKALQGELNVLNAAPAEAITTTQPVPPSPQSAPPEKTPADRETALQYIEQLRSIVGRRTPKPPADVSQTKGK